MAVVHGVDADDVLLADRLKELGDAFNESVSINFHAVGPTDGLDPERFFAVLGKL